MSKLDEIRESVERLSGFETSLAEKDRARMLAALDELLYVAENKTADNAIGRWWKSIIKGAIEKHLEANP